MIANWISFGFAAVCRRMLRTARLCLYAPNRVVFADAVVDYTLVPVDVDSHAPSNTCLRLTMVNSEGDIEYVLCRTGSDGRPIETLIDDREPLVPASCVIMSINGAASQACASYLARMFIASDVHVRDVLACLLHDLPPRTVAPVVLRGVHHIEYLHRDLSTTTTDTAHVASGELSHQ